MIRIDMKHYDNFAEMMENIIVDEIAEIECAISNEKLWAKGSDGEQSEQHKGNAEDLEEYKDILSYALNYGVIYCDKEIHAIWIEDLLNGFIKTLEESIGNYECWGTDTSVEKELIDVIRDLIG